MAASIRGTDNILGIQFQCIEEIRTGSQLEPVFN